MIGATLSIPHTPSWRGQGQLYLFVIYLDSVTAVFGIPRSATRYATTFGRKKCVGLKSSTGLSKFDIVLMSSFLRFLLPYFVFKYHYTCPKLSLLFLLSYAIVAFSTQMVIRYSSPPPPINSIAQLLALIITLLPFVTLFFPGSSGSKHVIRYQHFTISPIHCPLLFSQVTPISTNPLVAQFGISVNFLQILP